MRVTLNSKDLPKKWYNVIPDLGIIIPPPVSETGFSLNRFDLESLASSGIIFQELEYDENEIDIPEELIDIYADWRPTPLYRAERFERKLETPARIFYKYEGSSPSGSYEFNTAIAQAYYAKRQDTKVLVTATGNGEWGISLAIACNYFNIKCKIYMPRSAYDDRVYGRYIMELLGGDVTASPSMDTSIGKDILSKDPNHPGSLGIALSEAFFEAKGEKDAKFAWGTVMNHVLLHQTLIGLEAKKQMKKLGAKPDICIATVGGGSGFGGLVFPFYGESKRGRRFIAVETAAAPSLSKGKYTWDYTDSAGLAPMLKMYTLGHSYVPPGIHAGGMRYHGISPIISNMYREKLIEVKTYTQTQAFNAGIEFARSEGFIPSPEASYAIKAVVDEALSSKEKNEKNNILFLLSTNSNLDISTFIKFLNGAIEDKYASDDQVEEALRNIPTIQIQE